MIQLRYGGHIIYIYIYDIQYHNKLYVQYDTAVIFMIKIHTQEFETVQFNEQLFSRVKLS